MTDAAIRNAGPANKPRKLSDSGGLYLLLNPNGSRWRRLKYRFGGNEKGLSLGVYPAVGLKDARAKRDEMLRQSAAGIDPGQVRNAAKTAQTRSNGFEAVAREWIAKFSPIWAPPHSSKVIRRLERDVFPWMGSQPIDDITAPELLTVLRRIESRGVLETAHRALRNSGQVFRYAIATGRTERNPAVDLRGALPPVKTKHLAAMTDPQEVSSLLRAIDGY